MSPLSLTDKEHILDYCLGQLDPEGIASVEELIRTHPEAIELHQEFQSSLNPLSIQELLEPCPDDLAELTVSRLIAEAHPESSGLEALLSAEQIKPSPIKFNWWNKGIQLAAAAAILLFAAGIVIPGLRSLRIQSQEQRCENQLANIYRGMSQYNADFGSLPTVAMASGAPWWRVGDQGQENQSNTRPVWLLAREGYVQTDNFDCPGREPNLDLPTLDTLDTSDYRDFPNKEYLNYSFRLCCKNCRLQARPNQVLMADTNPLSELIPADLSKDFSIRLDNQVLNANSRNHQGKGQSILMGNGAVSFNTSRRFGQNQDDIFSLTSMISGAEVKGCEMPSCETDTFLAP